MPTPKGHWTDEPEPFVASPAQHRLRKRLAGYIEAALREPLIDSTLLSAEERIDIAMRVRRARSAQRWQKDFASTKPGMTSKIPEGTFAKYPTQPIEIPRGTRMRDVKQFLGHERFEAWRGEGAGTTFCGKRAAEMSRDELLAAIGWSRKSRDWWREFAMARARGEA